MVSESLLEIVDGEHRKEYARRHGIYSLMNMYHTIHWNDEESERVYKICNEKNITWQQYYGITNYEDMIF